MRTHHVWVGCLFLVGCFHLDGDRDREADDSGTVRTGSSPTRTVSSQDFCQAWAQAACSDAVVSACQATDAKHCRQSQSEFCRSLVPDQTAAAGGDECVSAVSAAYRDADLSGSELQLVLRLGGPCERVLRGTARAGDACKAANECDRSRGYACAMKSDSGAGTCQIPEVVSPGRDCKAPEKTCGSGFYCDGHNCIETLAAGEACSIQAQCAEMGFCNEAGQCAEHIAVNQPCHNDGECARGICSEFQGEQVCTDRVVLSRADPLCEALR